MTSSPSVLETRSKSSLSLLLPGTMTGSFVLRALSLTSSRKSAFRVFASGPWHVKQFSERIGKTSRRKSTGACAKALAPSRMPSKEARGPACNRRRQPDEGSIAREAMVSNACVWRARSWRDCAGGTIQGLLSPRTGFRFNPNPPAEASVAHSCRDPFERLRCISPLGHKSDSSQVKASGATNDTQPGTGDAVRADHDGAATALLLLEGDLLLVLARSALDLLYELGGPASIRRFTRGNSGVCGRRVHPVRRCAGNRAFAPDPGAGLRNHFR